MSDESRIPSEELLLRWLLTLTDEEKQTLLSHQDEVRLHLASLYAQETLRPLYAEPLVQDQIPLWLGDTHGRYCQIADWIGYRGPPFIAWNIFPGYTFREHAPPEGLLPGPDNRLALWEFVNDSPTERCIAHIIPQIPPDCRNKTVGEQMECMNRIRKKFCLPPHHVRSFGSVALLSAVILCLRNNFGFHAPENRHYIRTDTSHLFGPLNLGEHGPDGLHWTDWDFPEDHSASLGFFLVGIDPVINEDLGARGSNEPMFALPSDS